MIRYRPMKPGDVRECAAIVANHPVLGARYGDALRQLAESWSKLLGSDAMRATVFEELTDGGCRLLGAGVAIFVSDAFIRDLKSSKAFWIGPELAMRISRGESPALTGKQVREANSSDGLNLAVWQTGIKPEDLVRGEVGGVVMTAFVEHFRGFLLKESVTQAETIEHAEAVRLTGGFLWNGNKGSYQEFPARTMADLVQEPHVIGMDRRLASQRPGSWNASMFLHQAPQFGFSPGEQRLLWASLEGATDRELSDKLGISLATVKKSWRSIYERVSDCSAELMPPNTMREDGSSERGREKKQRLIAYLREHPEELRPYSRRLAQRGKGQSGTRGIRQGLA